MAQVVVAPYGPECSRSKVEEKSPLANIGTRSLRTVKIPLSCPYPIDQSGIRAWTARKVIFTIQIAFIQQLRNFQDQDWNIRTRFEL